MHLVIKVSDDKELTEDLVMILSTGKIVKLTVRNMCINPQSIQVIQQFQFEVENARLESISGFTKSQREFIRNELKNDSSFEIRVQCMEDIIFGLSISAKKKCFDFSTFNSGGNVLDSILSDQRDGIYSYSIGDFCQQTKCLTIRGDNLLSMPVVDFLISFHSQMESLKVVFQENESTVQPLQWLKDDYDDSDGEHQQYASRSHKEALNKLKKVKLVVEREEQHFPFKILKMLNDHITHIESFSLRVKD